MPQFLTDMGFYHWLAIGGGAVVVLGLLFYCLPVSQAKVPAILVSTVGAFGAGAALGIIALATFGYHWKPIDEGEGTNPFPAGPGPMGGMGSGGMRPPGMMGDFGRPTPKAQLATLVAKLDQLTDKPLAVNLDEKQRKKVREQLDGLADKKELSDEDAQKRLDALLDVVKGQKETLQAAGYRWPGGGGAGGRPGGGPGGRPGGGGPPAPPPPNPFKEGANAKHLKSLDDRLTKAP